MKKTTALVSLALSILPSLQAQDTRPAGGDPFIELPKIVVGDTRELPSPESWRYATIPGFEVLTNAPDRAAQRLIHDFDLFRQALALVWPVPHRVTPSAALILCGAGGKFDAFLPPGKAATATASRFLRQGNHTAIVIDLQATTLNVLNADPGQDAATGTDSGLISVEHDKQLYREYVRYLMSQAEPRAPAWLEEGLSQIFMKMRIDRRAIEVAKLEDPNSVSAQAAQNAGINSAAADFDADAAALPGAPAEDRDFSAALRRKPLVPLPQFFAMPHDAPEATNPLGNNIWAKQAYAFVHLCLYGHKGKFQKAFGTFLQRSARPPVTEAMFRECFGLTYRQMLLEIRSYAESTVYESKVFQSKKGGPDLLVEPTPVALREATQAEIGRIKGEALALAGHPEAARAELFAAYQRGERDPNLLAALGLFERDYGEEERARKFLTAAYAGRTTRADANIAIARLRFAEAQANPAGGDDRFSAAQVAGVIEPLLRARRPPPLYALYDLAGDTWMRSAVVPKPGEVALLIEGAQLFPTRMKTVYQAAALAAAAGEIQPAQALADHGIKWAADPAGKKRFEDLKASLPPAPAAAKVNGKPPATK